MAAEEASGRVFVPVVDATFFGKRGPDQCGALAAVDGLTGDPLASLEIGNETAEGYRTICRALKDGGLSSPPFAVIDGKRGAEAAVRSAWDIPVQLCQAHKIALADRYLLQNPRRESARALKALAHLMVSTDEATFRWGLESFARDFRADLEAKAVSWRTGKARYAYPRLRKAYRSLEKDAGRLFVCHRFLRETGGVQVNTSNRIEGSFSHLKPKVKVHRGLGKANTLALFTHLFWNGDGPT